MNMDEHGPLDGHRHRWTRILEWTCMNMDPWVDIDMDGHGFLGGHGSLDGHRSLDGHEHG